MESQKNKVNVKHVIITVIITLLISAVIVYLGGRVLLQSTHDSGYDTGYDIGYNDGYDEGRDIGYEEGYSIAEYDYGENDRSGYLGPSPDTYLTSDTAPAGTVWTTPYGEKYHETGCRYVNGRNDLTYFYSAEDAINAGYAPCSVCH